MDTFSWGTKFPPSVSGVDFAPLVSSGACFDQGFFRKSFRDVNTDSGLGQFAFHIPSESVFTISRNPYSPFPGTLIHMPRIPHSYLPDALHTRLPASSPRSSQPLRYRLPSRFLSPYSCHR